MTRISAKFVPALLLLFLTVAVCVVPSAEARELRLMSFNTYFMWDGMGVEECDHQAAIKSLPWFNNPERARAHMQEVATVIQRNRPDIAVLIEVENADAVNAMLSLIPDHDYKVYLPRNNQWGICQDVAMISRIPPVNDQVERDSSGLVDSKGNTKRLNKNLYARFDIDGFQFSVLGAHFIARPTDKSRREYREIQARILSQRASQLEQEGYPAIMMGDFNDYDHAIADVSDSDPITHVSAILRDLGVPDSEEDTLNLMQYMPEDQRYTALWDRNGNGVPDEGELTAIDHIFLSKSLQPFITGGGIDTESPLHAEFDHRPLIALLEF